MNWNIQVGLGFLFRRRAVPRRPAAGAHSCRTTAWLTGDTTRRDSLALAARQRDSLRLIAQQDSIRAAALRDSLRMTQDRARIASIRDSLERMALRDSLRLMMATDRMQVQGYASTQPVATNRTASGRAQNRRVELGRID